MKSTMLLSGMLIGYATVLYILLYRNISKVLDNSVEVHSALDLMATTQSATPLHYTNIQLATAAVSKDDYTQNATSTENNSIPEWTGIDILYFPNSVADNYSARYYVANTCSLSFAGPTDCPLL